MYYNSYNDDMSRIWTFMIILQSRTVEILVKKLLDKRMTLYSKFNTLNKISVCTSQKMYSKNKLMKKSYP